MTKSQKKSVFSKVGNIDKQLVLLAKKRDDAFQRLQNAKPGENRSKLFNKWTELCAEYAVLVLEDDEFFQ